MKYLVYLCVALLAMTVLPYGYAAGNPPATEIQEIAANQAAPEALMTPRAYDRLVTEVGIYPSLLPEAQAILKEGPLTVANYHRWQKAISAHRATETLQRLDQLEKHRELREYLLQHQPATATLSFGPFNDFWVQMHLPNDRQYGFHVDYRDGKYHITLPPAPGRVQETTVPLATKEAVADYLNRTAASLRGR